MLSPLLLSLGLILSSGPVTAQASTVQSNTATIPTLVPVPVARYPHDRNAFTQGLQYLGNGLYLESTGIVGASGVRHVNLKTGKVQTQAAMPLNTAFGEGSTALGGTIYQLTWQDGVAFTFDAKTLNETGRYKYLGEGWGLTTDGKQLIMSNGTPTLVWRDPKTFAVKRSVTVTDNGQTIRNLNELEYVQGSIYANIWLSDKIARIDPTSGKVTAWIDLSGLTREASATAYRQGKPLTFNDVPNGIAFIPERGTLLLTGKNWPTLFEVKLPGVKSEK